MSSMTRLKEIVSERGRAIALILFFSAGVVAIFQNCAQPGTFSVRSEASVQDAYPSPFDESPVRLDDETFLKSQTASQNPSQSASQADSSNETPSSKVEQPSPPTVVIVIDNACALHECAYPGNEEAVSCKLVSQDLIQGLAANQQYYTTSLPPVESAEDVTTWIRSTPADRACIIGVTEERTYQTGQAATDPKLSGTTYALQKSYLDAIGLSAGLQAFAAKNVKLAPVKVAVIDTGIADVADLRDVVVSRTDARSSATKAKGACGTISLAAPLVPHGTFVAGIIAARNVTNNGPVGVAPNARLYDYAIADCNGSSSTSEISNAILQAVDNVERIEVINLSFGGRSPDDWALKAAISKAVNRGVVILIAAGNDGQSLESVAYYPALYSTMFRGVMTVASTNATGTLSPFSNYSPSRAEIAAPGENIISTSTETGKTAQGQGTSYSAPLVSGAAALVIGYMKAVGRTYTPSMIESFVAESGVSGRTQLSGLVIGRAFLDIEKLAKTAILFHESPSSPSPEPRTPPVWSGSGSTQTVSTTIRWNLPVLTEGTRIGVFDMSAGCGYDVNCMVQDYPVTDRESSQTITFTRNDIAPLMGDKSDASSALFLGVALYRIDSSKRISVVVTFPAVNVRDLDRSNESSKLLGAIDVVRTDMQYVYFKGWACLQDSNKTATIGLVKASDNSAINVDSGYDYPYMTPHSGIIDGRGYGQTGRIDILEYTKVHFKDRAVQQAGLEGNPTIIDTCRTLTGAHAYELLLPVATARALGPGTKVKIKATLTGRTVYLKDATGKDEFTIPDVNTISTTQSNVTVSRANDLHTFEGSICSGSPSPITVEISYTFMNFMNTLIEGTGAEFGYDGGKLGLTHSQAISGRRMVMMDNKGKWGPTPDGSYGYNFEGFEASDFGNLDEIGIQFGTHPVTGKSVILKTLGQWFDEYASANKPNIGYSCTAFSPILEDAITSQQPRDPQGNLLKAICRRQTVNEFSLGYRDYVRANQNLSSAIQFYISPFSPYWDWHDVGEGFSLDTVGYKVDPTTAIGAYLDKTYKVKSLIREVRKFETPAPSQSLTLRLGQLDLNPADKCGSKYSHKLALAMPPAVDKAPYAFQAAVGYWRATETAPEMADLNAETAMRRIPYTLRFFQDGRMVLHLQAGTGSTTTAVNGYPFVIREN